MVLTHQEPQARRQPATPGAFGRFLAAYRGGLTRTEAARRAGLAETRWNEVESGAVTELSAHTVAAMCAALGADIEIGLQLAGYEPRAYEYLLSVPPGLRYFSPRLAPRIADYRAIGDVLESPRQDPRGPIGVIYREAAAMNDQLADELSEDPPVEGSPEYWAGYAAALRALAEEQLRMADQDGR